MGTRRIRTLSEKENTVVALFDSSEERRLRAVQKFGIDTFDTIGAALKWKPHALVVSTPPDWHQPYIELALQHGLHHFVEAGIRLDDLSRIQRSVEEQSLVGAPSCTFHFMPVYRKLAEVIPAVVGKLHSYQMYLSCNLPDWHPEERGKFYAYRPATGAAREMVPFELFWLNRLFGFPAHVTGSVRRLGNLETEARDTFLGQFDLENGACGQLSVIMASPQRFRRGCAGGDKGMVAFDVLTGIIEVFSPTGNATETYETGSIESVTEAAYEAEISEFYQCLTSITAWPHTYAEAARIYATLGALERSAASGRREPVNVELQPAWG